MYKLSILTARTPSLYMSAMGYLELQGDFAGYTASRQAGKRLYQYNTYLVFCQSPDSEIPHTFSNGNFTYSFYNIDSLPFTFSLVSHPQKWFTQFSREKKRASPYGDVPVFL
jgi:hypothetical protein